MWLGEDGRGIIFVVEPEDWDPRPASLLDVRAPDLPRPELAAAGVLLCLAATQSPVQADTGFGALAGIPAEGP